MRTFRTYGITGTLPRKHNKLFKLKSALSYHSCRKTQTVKRADSLYQRIGSFVTNDYKLLQKRNLVLTENIMYSKIKPVRSYVDLRRLSYFLSKQHEGEWFMWKEISAREISDNIIKRIAEEYMLITAGSPERYNMMTASWGFAGEMWGNDCAMAVVRPQRYTMEFLKNSDCFTLSFYGDNRDVHKVCGSKSGRDCDKTALTGLTPVFDGDAVYFSEAEMVIICRKQYVQRMEKDCFTDRELLRWYANEDYHYQIYGRIEKVLIKE